MKKIITLGVLLTLIIPSTNFGETKVRHASQNEKNSNSSRSLFTTYNQGYDDGFAFALQKVEEAVLNHPEWSIVHYSKLYSISSSYIWGIFVGDSEAQAATLAVNYVHASYYGGITANRTINQYYEGYYDGYLAGTAAAVIGQ